MTAYDGCDAVDSDELLAEARSLLPGAIDVRRRIHRWPEIGLDLPRTQQTVLEELADLPITVETGKATTSVTATLAGKQRGPLILLRADMDALPITEETGLDFASERAGAMHACGHDAHVAMLLGAARLLTARRHQIQGSVRFMFQPGEEGFHGARAMIEEGVLDGTPPVSAAFGLHVATGFPAGWVATRPGVMLASVDDFTITLTGRSGPAAAPHLARDPVPAACEVVLGIQSVVGRQVNPFDPAVVSVCSVHGGGPASNVTADRALLQGTVRAVSATTREAVLNAIRRVAKSVAAAHRLEVAVQVADGYPPTHNDPDLTGWALDAARALVGPERVYEMGTPTMSGDDFAFVLERVPGVELVIGAAPVDSGDAAPLHSSTMALEENAMATGIALHAALVLSYCGPGATGRASFER